MVELLTAALTVLAAAIPLAPPSLKSLRTWRAKRLARIKVTAVTPDKRSQASRRPARRRSRGKGT